MTPARACAIVAPAALFAIACEGVLPEPDFERMIEQRSYRAYEAAPEGLFADGRAMRPPPDRTVSRDRVLGDPALTEGADGARALAHIPIPVDRPLLARGRDRFENFCAACHGLLGDGVSPVAHNMELRKPRSLLEPAVVAFPPGHVYQVVTLGNGLMPSYASELDIHDRWAVVAYLRALQLSQRVPLRDLPEPLRARAERELR